MAAPTPPSAAPQPQALCAEILVTLILFGAVTAPILAIYLLVVVAGPG